MGPASGPLSPLAAEICGAIAQWGIYDCHEHLPAEKRRTAQYLDAFRLFSHCCRDDLRIAGMGKGDMAFVLDSQGGIGPKWRLFRPYYMSIRHMSYARAAHIAMQRFCGADELNDETVHTVTESMRRQNKPGLYDRILRAACGIITPPNNVVSMSDTDEAISAASLRSPA